MNTKQFVSTNGINSLLIDSPNSNIISVQFWFKAGSSLEDKADHGIAHFLEHMFFKGSKKYPDMKIAKTVEAFGGEINAFTSFDYTCYYINAPYSHGKKSLDVLLDMVCNPNFLKEDLIPERGVVFEEYLRSVDNPSQYNFFNIQKVCFPKGYNHAILGNEKTIKSFNLKQLKSFRSRYYNKKNSLLIVAGNIEKTSSYENLINKYKLPSGEKSEFPKFSLKQKSNINIHTKAVNQSTLTFMITAPDFSEETAAKEDLALNALTFGDMSPLYKYFIEETSMANGLSGSTMFFSQGGTHFFRVSFPSENIKKVLEALPKQLGNSIQKGFTQDDLDRIRNQYLASKVYERESIESYAFSLGHGFAQNGDINSDEHYIRSMDNVQTEDLKTSLQEVFQRPIHVTLQTPTELKGQTTKQEIAQCIESIKKISKPDGKLGKSLKPTPSKHDKSSNVIELSPGIKLIHRHNPLSETFALHCFIKGGLTEENKSNNGVYNLISKNITYGYKDVEYDELKKDLEKKASYINGFSGRNAYGLTLQGLSRYTNSLLEHFFNTLTQPEFPNDKFLIEKELICRTLHLQKEDPVKQCFKTFSNMVFKDHPYHMDIIGSEDSLAKIELNHLSKTHNRNLKQKELVITYCGNLPLNSVIHLVNAHLSAIKRQPKLEDHTKRKGPKPLANKNKEIEFDREQTHLMMGKAAFKNNTIEDSYLKIFTTLLSGQSSDLFLQVRDKQGLCYTVQPLHNSSIEAGYWGIYMGTSVLKYDQALAALKEIIEKYRKKGVSRKEFNMVKEMIYGQNLVNIQTNDDYAYFYSVPVLHGLGIDYPYNTLEKIRNVKLEDLNKFLKEFLKDSWSLVKVGRL